MSDVAMIASKKYAPETLGRVLVLGLGKSGHDAVDYLMPLLGGRVSELAIFGGAHSAMPTRSPKPRARRALTSRSAITPWRSWPKRQAGISSSPSQARASPNSPSCIRRRRASATKLSAKSSSRGANRRQAAAGVAVTGTNGQNHGHRAYRAPAEVGGPARCGRRATSATRGISAVGANAADVYVAEVSSCQLGVHEALRAERGRHAQHHARSPALAPYA